MKERRKWKKDGRVLTIQYLRRRGTLNSCRRINRRGTTLQFLPIVLVMKTFLINMLILIFNKGL